MSDVHWHVFVDWEGNGNFTGPDDDISADLDGVRLTFGRGSALDEIRPALFEARLDNAARKYSRYNSSSPLFGLMLAGRPVRVVAEHPDGTLYQRFSGELENLSEDYSLGIPRATLRALDHMERLRRTRVRTELFEGYTVDALLEELLNAADYAHGIDHDEARTTLDYWWAHRNEDVLAAATKLAKNELGGLWYLNRFGDSRFENRDARAKAEVYGTITDAASLSLQFRQGDLIDRVELQRGGLAEDSSVTAVYTLSPGGRILMPGSDDPRNRISFDWVGAKGAVTPVAVTDWTANSEADGSGTDKTSQLMVAQWEAFGGGGEIVFNNLDASPVYLVGSLTFRVRATAIRRSNEDRTLVVESANPLVSGQPLQRTFDWNDNIDDLVAFAEYLAETLDEDQPRFTLPLLVHTEAEAHLALGIDVSKRVTVTLTTGLYPPEISGDYFVEGGTIEDGPDMDLRCSVTLWSKDQGLGNAFRISDDDAGGDQEYSAIADDGDTTGDRIWF